MSLVASWFTQRALSLAQVLGACPANTAQRFLLAVTGSVKKIGDVLLTLAHLATLHSFCMPIICYSLLRHAFFWAAMGPRIVSA